MNAEEPTAAPTLSPLILTVAPNGARKGKEDHPALPITPEELAETAAACQTAGAAMIHCHVRDAEGAHSLDPGRYREAFAAIRAAVGEAMILQATSEAAGRYGPAEQRAAMRALAPEALSLAIRELLPDGDAEAREEGVRFLAETAERGALIQYILYDAADVARFRALQGAGAIPEAAPQVLFVLGRYAAGQRSTPAALPPFLEAADGAAIGGWSVCAFGPLEAACGLTAAGLGGHVRIGFENNSLMADGRPARDNAALVTQSAGALALMGRRPGAAAEARALWRAAA